MAMECGLWYARKGEVRKGFQTKSMKSGNTLLANPTWNGEFHQVEWKWVYAWTAHGGDSLYKGFLRILFRQPVRGRQIDMSAVRGTIAFGNEKGHFKGMECSEEMGQWSWGIKVDWNKGDEVIWATTVFIYTGVAQDDDGNPFIGCEAIEETGFRGDTLHVVGKRDSNKLTGDEKEALGADMAAGEYKRYANVKYGKKHHVMVSDYEGSSEGGDEEMGVDTW